MIKLLGSACLMVGAVSIGMGAATQLKNQVTVLRSLVEALGQLQRELSFRLTAMPDLMERLAFHGPSPANQLFARCYEGINQLGQKSFAQIWEEALEEEEALCLTQRPRQILLSLGEVLGRYDRDNQQDALQRAVEDLGDCLNKAETEWGRLGRVYTPLGLGAGAMLVLLLL